MIPQQDKRLTKSSNHNKQLPSSSSMDDDEDEVYYNDMTELSPTEFFSKYYGNIDNSDDDLYSSEGIEKVKKQASFKDISSDVLCYIIMNYLDWRTVFSGCLLVNKEFFRRIANNRTLFINLFNELFVLQQEEIENLTEHSTFKHKKSEIDDVMYGGLGVPNEHYHFWKDYESSIPDKSEIEQMCKTLKKHYVKNRTMTESKLRLIREIWNNSVNVYKKSKNIRPSRSKKEENQALLNLIKRIIKDRLFLRKYFNGNMKSLRIEAPREYYFMRKYSVNYAEASKMVKEQPALVEQVENLVYGSAKYELNELEEIATGYCTYGSDTTDQFLKCMLKYPFAQRENITSFASNDIRDREMMISQLYTSDIWLIFEMFPNLRAFYNRGSIFNVTPIKSFNLSVLVLVTGGMKDETLTGILDCDFPQLKHLELWFGSYSYYNSVRPQHLTELLSPEENGKYPMLEYFGIRNAEQAEQFIIPIANSALLKRLRIFDMSLSVVGVIGALPGIVHFANMLEEKGRPSFPLLELVDFHRNNLPEDLKLMVYEIFDRLGIMVDLVVGLYGRGGRYIAVGE